MPKVFVSMPKDTEADTKGIKPVTFVSVAMSSGIDKMPFVFGTMSLGIETKTFGFGSISNEFE